MQVASVHDYSEIQLHFIGWSAAMGMLSFQGINQKQ